MSHSIDENQARNLHIAFVTDDVEKTAGWLAELIGVPFPTINVQPSVEIAQARYHGEAANPGFRQAYMYWGEIGIEVLEPDDQPSVFRDFLDRRGPGVHHIGFWVDGIESKTAEFEAEGYPSLQSANFPGGCYTFPDTENELGVFIELLSKRD
jgi:4-hydroxyphenylpyruvate dioxygenase-like putative hemolysin